MRVNSSSEVPSNSTMLIHMELQTKKWSRNSLSLSLSLSSLFLSFVSLSSLPCCDQFRNANFTPDVNIFLKKKNRTFLDNSVDASIKFNSLDRIWLEMAGISRFREIGTERV